MLVDRLLIQRTLPPHALNVLVVLLDTLGKAAPSKMTLPSSTSTASVEGKGQAGMATAPYNLLEGAALRLALVRRVGYSHFVYWHTYQSTGQYIANYIMHDGHVNCCLPSEQQYRIYQGILAL